MRHIQIPDQNNSLYGYKTELTELLRSRELPRWLKDSPIHAGSLYRDISVKEAFEKGAERAREHRERFDSDAPTYAIEFFLDTESRVTTRAGHTDVRVPDAIWEKLDITPDDAHARLTNVEHVHPDEYRLAVEVGPQGGINDMQIVREFRYR